MEDGQFLSLLCKTELVVWALNKYRCADFSICDPRQLKSFDFNATF